MAELDRIKLPNGTVIDVNDIRINTFAPTDGQVLAYNSVSGKFENSDTADGLPPQTGNAGKFLTTDGSDASWEEVQDTSFVCNFTITSFGETEQRITCDKSIAEIIAAAQSGKNVKGFAGDGSSTDLLVTMSAFEDHYVIFQSIIVVFGAHLVYFSGDNSTGTDEWEGGIFSYSEVAFSGDYEDLRNRPTLGTASALDVAESGNASTTQVVKGDDTRLSDSRNAADVYPWAKAATKPSYTASEVGAIASSEKGSNNGVAELDATGKVPSSQLPSYVDDVLEYASLSAFPATGESGKIYIALDTNKTYRWSGSTYTEISESLALGETSSTAYAGNKGKANADAIAAIKDGATIDSFADVEAALADKINKSSTSGLVKNDGTIDTNTYLTQHQDISGKADKVSNATNGNFAALDSSGNLTDSGHKHSDYLTSHQDISGKADKVSNATNGNFAALDSNGNLTDSGHKHSDYLTSQVNADWNSSSGVSQILNKPTLGSAAAKNVPSSGDASTSEVVLGNDSRLSDARTPLSHIHGNITNDGKIGTVSGKILTTGTGGEIQASDSITKSMISDFPTLATVATSGSYNDLSNKPTIPAAQIQSDYMQIDNTAADFIKNAPLFRVYRNVSGTAGKTSSPYRSTKWDVTDNTITEYVDGMVVVFTIPVAGVATYGCGLQVNNLGYKPVVYGANTTVGTRYPVNGIILAVYNETQTGNLYYDSSSATVETGCWQVMDYDANTTAIYTLMYYRGTRDVYGADLKRYVLSMMDDENRIIPLNGVGSTATTKTMTTSHFNPFRGVLYYSTNTTVVAGNPVSMSTMYRQSGSVDARYSFNCAQTLTSNLDLYLVMEKQSDGLCALASTPWTQTLPATNDGKLYLLLGHTYSKYQFELYPINPIFYHDGTTIKQYSGDKTFSGDYNDLTNKPNLATVATSGNYNDLTNKPTIPDAVSGTNDGTNWTTITIGNVTKNIPSGGGGGLSDHDFTHTANTTVSTSTTTVTFAANTRGSAMLTISADLGLTIACNNGSDNYIWVKNTGSAEVDITISAVTQNSTNVNNVYVPSDGITVPAGGLCEIGIIVNTDGAFITSRNDLAL